MTASTAAKVVQRGDGRMCEAYARNGRTYIGRAVLEAEDECSYPYLVIMGEGGGVFYLDLEDVVAMAVLP